MSFQRLLARLDAWLTKLEVAVCLSALAALIVSLTLWVALKGLGARTSDSNQAGLVFRALIGAILFGAVARRLTRRNSIAIVAMLAGLEISWLWRGAGLEWAGNMLGWLQDGSAFTLLGGLRGFGTRLTLILALTGGALATGAGRHVTVDVIARGMPERSRRPIALIGALLASVVCFTSAWGFADYIAVDVFRAPIAKSAISRLGLMATGIGRHAFLLRRQIALDARMVGPVLVGRPWDRSLTGEEWNRWLDSGDWRARYSEEQVAALRDTEGGTRGPLIVAPGEAPRGLLAKSFNLIVPLGLFWLGLRFLLWCLRGAPVDEPVRSEAASEAAGAAPS